MNASFASAADRPLRLTPRRDVLTTSPGAVSGRCVVTDPVTLAHFELSEEEHALLVGLDKEGVTLRQLRRLFERRFAPRRVSEAELQAYLSRLTEAGLVVSELPGQADALWRMEEKRRANSRRWGWTRLLAMRTRGVDPDRFLQGVAPWLGGIFSFAGLVTIAVLAAIAASILFTNFDRFLADLPRLDSLSQPGVWLLLLATVAAMKTLHELGHAVGCKRGGGAVHELGVMLLAFTPCLYCDVSDAWRLPSRAGRMLVSAAGVLVEIALASIAVLVWRYSEPGLVRLLAVNTIVVGALGTLVVNANPLMRYDGYYLLSDLTRTPNLWERSRKASAAVVGRWFFRPPTGPPSPAEPTWMAAYGVVSRVYLTVVMATIVMLLFASLAPLRLQAIAWGLAILMASAMIAGPIRQAVGFAGNPIARRRLRGGRAVLASLAAIVIAAAALNTPLPHRVTAAAVVAPRGATAVAVTMAGRLVHAAAPGDWVSQGDVVARLANPDTEHAIARLRGEVAEQRLVVEHLGVLRAEDPQSGTRLPAARATLEALSKRLTDLEAESERLTLRAPRDGVVTAPQNLASPSEASGAEADDRELSTWRGSPLDAANRAPLAGAWLEEGTVVCQVGEPSDLVVEAFVDESQSDLIRPGQPVRLAIGALGPKVVTGKLVEVSRRTAHTDRENPAQGLWFARSRATLSEEAICLALIEFDEPPAELPIGALGRVKIDAGATPLGERLLDTLSRLFWSAY
ncbi:hypothetical protein Mal64_02600 [Pseudobythopirellula maris]|uniref:Peptidase family M50 n=1 Tax=Pseudobythopirellula maris TaxID=2527991 RepID=A0A5C5ZS50_9BACT|nr:HlyD family efflux transporter periplasmic adaptor subunit [Pseudobythopirellula maris]TWT89878.1 hypothetical protein Mal64_02600 [Pseudobythopirellula maris]